MVGRGFGFSAFVAKRMELLTADQKVSGLRPSKGMKVLAGEPFRVNLYPSGRPLSSCNHAFFQQLTWSDAVPQPLLGLDFVDPIFKETIVKLCPGGRGLALFIK